MIKISKEGKIYHRTIEGETIEVNSLILHLQDELILEEGTTFETFFNLIIREKENFNAIFYGALGGHEIDSFLGEWEKDPIESYGVNHLEVGRSFEIIHDNENKNSHIEFKCEFYGVSDESKVEGMEGEEIEVGISFSPINCFKPLVLKINNKLEISSEDNVEFRSESTFPITFYDAMCSIFLEITWNGDPKARDKRWKEIEKDLKIVTKKDLKFTSENDGISFTFEMDEWQENENFTKDLLETELKNAVENEEYEKASILKKKIDEFESDEKKEEKKDI